MVPDADEPSSARVAEALREIGALLAIERGNRFRAQAYERAADVVEAVPDVAALAHEHRLTELPGIGNAIGHVIQEICSTGRSRMLERLRSLYPPGASELSQVLSLPRLRAVHAALGVSTLAALKLACEEGRVRELSGFGPRSEAKLLARIDALAARPRHILLPEALAQANALRSHLERDPAVDAVEIAGDLRRRVETIDRLDLVVVTREPAAVAARAERMPGATNVEQVDAFHFVVHRPGKLDARIHVAAPDHAAAALVIATGSEAHVRRLTERARGLHLALDRGGLRRGDRELAGASEHALYAGLGLAPIAPELREDAGEIEAAAVGALPRDLLALGDIRGAVHCHTDYSDGKHTIEEMARAAEALGYDYLTITDHSASATYARGLDVDRLRLQADEIARVQQHVGIRLLHGTESDILRDGALDYPTSVLEELDVVIASVHQRYRMDAKEMTARVVRALRQPVFKIWGHALGRYVLSRPPFDCDMDEILDAVAESRTAIEVNGDPHRLDLAPPWIREAKKRGVRFVVSTDAHSTRGLENVKWGVDMARRGWLEKRDVLNVLGAEEFAAAVRP
jgi:DNA polymerase (family 10)